MSRVADVSRASTEPAHGRGKNVPAMLGQGVFAVAAVKRALEALRGDQSSEARRASKVTVPMDETQFLKELFRCGGDRRRNGTAPLGTGSRPWGP